MFAYSTIPSIKERTVKSAWGIGGGSNASVNENEDVLGRGNSVAKKGNHTEQVAFPGLPGV